MIIIIVRFKNVKNIWLQVETNDVFICYESRLSEIANEISSALKRKNISCWGQGVVTDSYWSSIENAIKNSKIFVLIMDQRTADSTTIMKMVELAYRMRNYGVRIIPFKIDASISERIKQYLGDGPLFNSVDQPLNIAIEELTGTIVKLLLRTSEEIEAIHDSEEYFREAVSGTVVEPYEVNLYRDKKSYVFVCYSHDDSELVLSDLRELKNRGVYYWYDEGIYGGEKWKEKVTEKINDHFCNGVLFFLSESSVSSENVAYEMDLVQKRADADPVFKIASMNIGGEKVFDMLKKSRCSEDRFVKTLKLFSGDRLFFPRDRQPEGNRDLDRCVKTLSGWKVVSEDTLYTSHIILANSRDPNTLVYTKYRGSSKSVVIKQEEEHKIVALGPDAFLDSNVESVIIPDGVESIGKGCFRNCGNLINITLPMTLSYVGYEAFRDCKSLKSIVFHGKVTDIGDYAFYGCESLKTVYFNTEQPVRIGFACFSECVNLMRIILPNEISELGDFAFNKCWGLETIDIRSEIEKMGKHIFFNCPHLKTIEAGPGIVSKSTERLFDHCPSLRNIVISKELVFKTQKFGTNFYNHYEEYIRVRLPVPEDLQEVNGKIQWREVPDAEGYEVEIRENQTYAGKTIIESAEKNFLEYAFDDAREYYISVRATSTKANMRESHHSVPYYRAATILFDIDKEGKILRRYNGAEKQVTVPKDILVIGEKAFYNKDIESVVLPETLKTIGASAFRSCSKLSKIDIPNSVETIERDAFEFCIGLKEIRFPEGLKTMGDQAFANCSAVEQMDLSRTKITKLNQKVFYRCAGMKKILLPTGLEIIDDSAFRGSVGLTNINSENSFSNSLTKIGDHAFSFMAEIINLKIPPSVQDIGMGIFTSSSNISVVKVDEQSKNFYVENNTLIQRDNRTALCYPRNRNEKEYKIPSNVKAIREEAFYETENFCNVILEGVTFIKSRNFKWCPKLQSVTLGEEIKEIGDGCFAESTQLKEIKLNCKVPPKIGKECFKNLHESFVIKVGDALDNYRNEPSWDDYKHMLVI
jgi:hypothetical protein